MQDSLGERVVGPLEGYLRFRHPFPKSKISYPRLVRRCLRKLRVKHKLQVLKINWPAQSLRTPSRRMNSTQLIGVRAKSLFSSLCLARFSKTGSALHTIASKQRCLDVWSDCLLWTFTTTITSQRRLSVGIERLLCCP